MKNKLHFGGLVKDPYNHSLLDGQPQHDYWCFAIGMYCNSINEHFLSDGIPGFCEAESRVRLFARVNSVEVPLDYLFHDIMCSQKIVFHPMLIQVFLVSLYELITI